MKNGLTIFKRSITELNKIRHGITAMKYLLARSWKRSFKIEMVHPTIVETLMS